MIRPCAVCGNPMDVVEVGRDTHPCCDPAFTSRPPVDARVTIISSGAAGRVTAHDQANDGEPLLWIQLDGETEAHAWPLRCVVSRTPTTQRVSRRAAVTFIRAWNRRAYELRSAKHQPTAAYHAARARAGLTRTEQQ